MLGPCEPLIPFIFVSNPAQIVGLFFVFLSATIGTMLLVSQFAFQGLSLWKIPGINRLSHVLAGTSLIITGITSFVFKI